MPVDDFLVRALLAGVGVAAVAGPLGCFVLWRRMAYVGDTMAHAALLGVAVGLALSVAPIAGILAVTIAIALLLVFLQQRSDHLAADSLLGILSHAALSFGLVGIGLLAWVRVDLVSLLFGDILAVTGADVATIWAGGAVVLALLAAAWRPLLAATVHADLARAEGVPVVALNLLLCGLIAVVIALSMKIVGVLLITSLLIIPAATARRFSPTPERMALLAIAFGASAVLLGLALSLRIDTPAGPSIVVASALLFALAQFAGLGRRSCA